MREGREAKGTKEEEGGKDEQLTIWGGLLFLFCNLRFIYL